MFYKKACPICNHANRVSHFRSKFSMTCEHCGSTLRVDGGGFVNFWIETLTFIPLYLLIASSLNAIGNVLHMQFSEVYRLSLGLFAAWVLHGFMFPYLSRVKVQSHPAMWRLF
ncbi:MAG: hypothetical protein RI964_2085 [Pseudomonadota bacterium]